MSNVSPSDHLSLTVRVAGNADFKIELEPLATVADAKLAATAGCDIDPELMRIIHCGKILRDDAMLMSSGVKSEDALHIARGKPARAAGACPEAPSADGYSANTCFPTADVGGAHGQKLKLTVKAPGGHERTVDTFESTLIEQLRTQAADESGLTPAQIHLVHKGRTLKDGLTLAQSGVKDADTLRIARRASSADAPATEVGMTTIADNETSTFESLTGPMPSAWNSSTHGMTAEQMQMIRQLGATGAIPEQVAAALQGGGRAAAGPGLVRDEQREHQDRLDHEVRLMEHHVRQLIRNRLRIGPGGQRVQTEAGRDLAAEEDPELLDEIARMMAEARSRGAPVPNAGIFVDRALDRARNRRATHERLRREAGDMDPDLEDAVEASERMAAAAERAPRRLGGTGTGAWPGNPGGP